MADEQTWFQDELKSLDREYGADFSIKIKIEDRVLDVDYEKIRDYSNAIKKIVTTYQKKEAV